MNCPNCGGLLNLKERHCEYCDTTFTEEELYPEKSKVSSAVSEVKVQTEEASAAKSLTEIRREEIAREKACRAAEKPDSDAENIAIGVSVMGVSGLFSGVRSFFRELKRTLCFVLLMALEAGFCFLMLSSTVTELIKGEIEGFAAINAVVLINALLAGLICRIGRIRIGTPLVAIINFLAVVWIFIYPLISSGFEGVDAKTVAILAVIEMAVLAISVVLAHLIYRR